MMQRTSQFLFALVPYNYQLQQSNMGCQQSNDYSYVYNSANDAYRCRRCNLLQCKERSHCFCRYCLARPQYHAPIDFRAAGIWNTDLSGAQRNPYPPRWQRCSSCMAIQYTIWRVCQFCLASELLQNDLPSHSHMLLIFEHSRLIPNISQTSAPREFIRQQISRKMRGSIWSFGSIMPFDQTFSPNVNPSQIWRAAFTSQQIGFNMWTPRAALVSRQEVNEQVQAVPSAAPTVRQIAPNRPSKSPSPVKNISKKETEDIIDKLADLLDPDRGTVRKILQHYVAEGNFWECPQCTLRNPKSVASCEICHAERGDTPLHRDDRGQKVSEADKDSFNNSSKEDIIEQALEAIQCPICLDVYEAPITLPCGHSICIHHAPQLTNNECPICRSPFTHRDVTVCKNKALCKNVNAVIKLASLADPDRETIRHAAARFQESTHAGEIFEVSTMKAAQWVSLDITLRGHGDGVYVKRVGPTSPFVGTRLQVDCEVISINGLDCHEMTPVDAADILKKAVGEVLIVAMAYL